MRDGCRDGSGSAPSHEHEPGSTGESHSEAEMRELGRITGELLHDLGGILAVLSGRVSLAREETALGRIPAEELSRIQSDTDELRRMVVEILEEMRNRPRSLEVTFPVSSTIDETVNRWLVGAPSVNTTLRSSLSPRAEIAGPRSFFTRALGNLLRNAARHACGEIRITLRPSASGDSVRIQVEDDGEGVSPSVRERVFEPFISGAAAGTGLGLSFARWGIERLGGTLELLREPTDLGGAAFLLEVPLARFPRHRHGPRVPASAEDRPVARSSTDSLSGLRVVVVDDDPAVRRTLARLLRRSGAQAVEIDPTPWTTSEDACGELTAADPDVILLDVNLHRVSGPEVAHALQRCHPDLVHRLLFVTGGSTPSSLADHTVVSKMIGWDELVTQILRVAAHTSGGG